MANPEDDEWWASTAPTPVTVSSDVFKGTADDDWWESTKPQVSHASLDPTPEELEDDDYWNGFTSWARRQGPVTRTLGRIPVRAGEDLYNALNDYFEFSTRANWEDEIFDEPQSAVEDITAEIGSWLGTFWVPGGAVAKVATSVSKATGISKKAAKLSGLISTTAKGKKAIRVGQIAAEGALRGAVADYITTDIEDHEQNLSIQRRFEATIEGGLLGAGVNLTTFGIGRHVSLAWRKLRALKKVRQASEGKADPVGALKELKKVIEDENQIKDDVLAELKPSDDLVDEADPELNKIFDEPEPKVEEPKPPVGEAAKEVEAPKVGEPEPPKVEKDPELQIEEYIDRASSLPDQIRRMVTLEHGVATRLNPKINNLIELLNKGDTENVRKLVSTLEVDIRRYRKLMEIRARAGKITGQSLRAFAADPLDFFSKSMVYKPEVIRRMNQIDSLLKLTRDVKAGKIKDEVIIKELNREIADVDSVIKGKSLADALSDSFGITVDDSVTTIWGNYKSRIAKNVANTLKKKSPQQKATLDIFSTRITKTLSDAVKSDTKVAKKVSGVLDNVQDILANPEKYRESITKTIKEISEAKNIKAADKSKAIDTLTDLVEGKEGKRLFDLLPNREKLVSKIINEELKEIGTSLNKSIKEGTERELLDQVVKRIADKTDLGPIEKEVLLDHVRADLSNALAEMRDQVIRKFRSKELFQKFNLRSNIRELDEMSDKSIKEIREYLARKVGEKQTPADIKALQTEAREALKVLKDKVKQADIDAENELTKRFIKELSGMQEFDISAMGNFELMLRAFEKLRLNMMLFSPRTWLVGVPSAAFNVAYQPVQQAVKTFIKAKTNPFEDISTAKAFKLAQAEIQGMSEYFSNYTTFWELIKETYRNNGQSAILPRSFRRHEEDLIEAGTGAVESKPLKVTFKDKKKLAELIRKYGVKNEANEKGFRKFMLELVEGEPTTQMGRILDPVFSVSFRAMGILDEPFKAMGLMRALRSQALREGISKGLDEKALNIYVDKRMKEALVDKDGLPQWAGKEEFDEVEQLGLAMTYQADYADKYFSQAARAFSNWSRGGEDAHYNPLKIAFRLQVPFIKTPTAIAQFGLDHFPPTALIGHVWKSVLKRSPLHQQLDGLAKEIEQNTAALTAKEASEDIKKKAQESLDDLLEKQQELTLKLKEQEAEATTNMIMGTALTSSLAFAATTGAITGTGAYLTQEQKQRLIDSGWRPNSIMIGDKRVSYGRLEPWSTFMSSMADIVHYMGMTGQHFDELSDTDKSYINALQSSIVENMTNKFFIRGLYETLELALNPKKKAMDLPVNFLGSLTPTIVRDVATMNEQFQREAVEWQAQAKERTLGLHPGQYRRNLLGEKVNRVWGMDGFWGIISPVTWTDKPKDKLMEEIAGLRGKLGQTHVYRKKGVDTRKFYHKKTGQSLYDAWMDKMEKARDFDGLTLRNRLNLLIKSQEYLTAPQIQIDPEDIPKSKLIVNEVSKFRNDVWSEIENDPKFRENFLSNDGDSWTDQITNEGLRNKVLEPLTELVGF
jgi:hypothetical protein